MEVHTTVVGPDGMIHIPTTEARPGETVRVEVMIRQRERRDAPLPKPVDSSIEGTEAEVPLTRLTARTPEQKEELQRRIRNLLSRIQPAATELPGSADHGEVLYDELGLPR